MNKVKKSFLSKILSSFRLLLSRNAISDAAAEWAFSNGLKHIYTDSSGIRYYELEDMTRMAWRRAVAGEIQSRQSEYCLTREDLKKIIEKMKAHANKGEFTEVFILLGEIEQRLEFAGEEETLLGLASVYFFEEMEDVADFDQIVANRKIERWRNDSSAKSFFLRRAFERTKIYMLMLEADMPDYSFQPARNQRKIEEILGRQSLIISTN